MIPYAILRAELTFEDGTAKDVRILDLSVDEFTFRLVKRGTEWPAIKHILLHFFDFEEQLEEELLLELFTCGREKEPFYDLFRVQTEEPGFFALSKKVSRQYLTYIRLKQSGDDAQLSAELTGYPAGEQHAFWTGDFTSDHVDPGNDAAWKQVANGLQLALSLDHPQKWEQYLKCSGTEFQDWLFENHGLKTHPLKAISFDRIYLGNQYCSFLLPDKDTLLKILRKAAKEHTKITLVLAPVKEHEMGQILELLREIAAYQERRRLNRGRGLPVHDEQDMELVVNDWGIIRGIRESGLDGFELHLGILLGKRRKDVRFPWKKEGKQIREVLAQNALDAAFFKDYLHEKDGITKFCVESCSYPIRMTEEKVLHLPFYQMNTAGHCTLAAYCEEGDRGKQRPRKNCPQYCREHIFLYPDFLKMVGRYNTLFGYDEQILRDPDILQTYIRQGLHRIVLEVL